ncbi:MAG: tyrosine protein kinase:aminoglycoside phosphotransferase [Candidatus Binatia bacterium]|nr:MAG: tyrosine protein kinase:aminoglycoside phosphotransferase [Candidatus Binatia bacterium]
MRSRAVSQDELAERLARYLAERLRAEEVRVLRLERLAGGASRETWGVDAEVFTNGHKQQLDLILRSEPAGSRLPGQCQMEFHLLRRAAEAGVAVPAVLWVEADPEVVGAPFLVMERVAGETLPRRLLRDATYRDARRALPEQLASALAAIHRIDPQSPELAGLPRPPDHQPAALYELDRFEQLYRAVALDPHPVFELAFRWLRHHAVPEDRRTLVHGDFRVGNIIFGSEGLRAVLDWELAHVGDPLEDIGWLCVRSWRFGNDHLPVGGLAPREVFYQAYERAAGKPVDRQRARYWEILGNLKWGVITILQFRSYLHGRSSNVELASLGRRTAEVEWELLRAMKGEAV